MEQEKTLKIDEDVIDFVFSTDSFRMFNNNVKPIVNQMTINRFNDCQQITAPNSRNDVFIIINGGIAIVDDERTLKRVNNEVKKTRRKRKKAQEKRLQEQGGNTPKEGHNDGPNPLTNGNAADQQLEKN